MPRLFVALDLPETHKAHLAGLRDVALPARWTPPEQYHVTLRFVGEVSEERAADVERALATVQQTAFVLEGHGLNVFPSLRAPRVLFAGIDATQALLGLHAQIERTLRAAGVAADPKPFHPHVTLARLRRARSATVRAFLRAHQAFTLSPFAVSHVYLYESLLRPEGALHRRRAAFALQ